MIKNRDEAKKKYDDAIAAVNVDEYLEMIDDNAESGKCFIHNLRKNGNLKITVTWIFCLGTLFV